MGHALFQPLLRFSTLAAKDVATMEQLRIVPLIGTQFHAPFLGP
jgi:hypothetical protein